MDFEECILDRRAFGNKGEELGGENRPVFFTTVIVPRYHLLK